MAEDRLDVLIFGATGYTGKYTVKEAVKLSGEKKFKWGIAGRRQEALEAVVKEFAPDQDIPIVIADINDQESLNKMAGRAKIVVSCCGPYRFYGEPVVKACIETGTHYVDVSGEPQFIERMDLEYNELAKKAGVYIVSACGLDSIPCDLGVVFVQNKFDGEVNAVESYLTMESSVKPKGAMMNYGTWESLVHGVANKNDLRSLRKELFKEKIPEFEPKLESRGIVHWSSLCNKWSTVFPGADRAVSFRTQRFFFNQYKQRPVQLRTYITYRTFFELLVTVVFGVVLLVGSMFECGIKFLLKHPKLCTGGVASRDGPDPEFNEKIAFEMKFKATGWSEKLAEPTDQHTEPPNKEMLAKVSGTNPGYGATSTMLMLSALTILRESDKMPNNGGVLSPGAAFAKTSIIEELNKHDVKFEVVSSIET